MMTRAYQEIYRDKAQSVLGDAFDYAIHTCGIPGNDFVKLFIAGSVSKRMENGEPACISGKSGIEIVREIVAEAKGEELQIEPEEHFGRSREYWIGWAAAYYQWYSDRKYSDIFEAVSFEDLQQMYVTLHEADITKFAEIMEARIREHFPETSRRQSLQGAPASAFVRFRCMNREVKILIRRVQIRCTALPKLWTARWKI